MITPKEVQSYQDQDIINNTKPDNNETKLSDDELNLIALETLIDEKLLEKANDITNKKIVLINFNLFKFHPNIVDMMIEKYTLNGWNIEKNIYNITLRLIFKL